MSGRSIDIRGRKVWIEEAGDGAPLVWLHGFADVHGASAGLMPVHEELAKSFHVIAPAHPGCAASDEDTDIDTVDDAAFHCLEVVDALGLDSFHLAGSSIGGWLAAELAVRHRERVRSLSLIGATGLFVSGEPIGDIFYVAQPENGVTHNSLRELLFASANSPEGHALYPDPRGTVESEILRYQMYRFAARIGFKPPYLHNRLLRGRLPRYEGPALVVWGAGDRMVPLAHAHAYADGLANARLEFVKGAGHSVHAEKPAEVAKLVAEVAGN